MFVEVAICGAIVIFSMMALNMVRQSVNATLPGGTGMKRDVANSIRKYIVISLALCLLLIVISAIETGYFSDNWPST